MKDMIRIDYEYENPTVRGRELHARLEVATQYKDWSPRMREYGFKEGRDFSSILSESTKGRPSTDHALSISMAMELCILEVQTETGVACE